MYHIIQKIKRRLFEKTKNKLICYRAQKTSVEFLFAEKKGSDILSLPSELIIAPGVYSWKGSAFSLMEEGVYRFSQPEKENAQRIVFKENVELLLSAIAWIVSHGCRDDKYSFKKLAKIAKKDKLYLTCERVCQWASYLLSQYHIKHRLLYLEEKIFSSTYDGGHVMIEVYVPSYHQWILYDVDMGVFFSKNHKPLSLLSFLENCSKGEYDIEPMAKDSALDVSGFRSAKGFHYHFLMEAVVADLKKWYAKVGQVDIILENGKRYYLENACKFPHPNNVILDRKRFVDKFYA